MSFNSNSNTLRRKTVLALAAAMLLPAFAGATNGVATLPASPLPGLRLRGKGRFRRFIMPASLNAAASVQQSLTGALALLPFVLGFVALLNPPVAFAAPWLLASLLLTYVGFSAATVAYQAWGATLGMDALGRTRLTAAREGFGLFGVLIAAALPSLLAPTLNEGIARLSWGLPPLVLLAAVLLWRWRNVLEMK
jgi:hypothetical protein